jgi:hypothetical protein
MKRFSSAEGVKVSLRVLHADESITKRKRIGKEWIETVEEHRWWWATTFPFSQLPSSSTLGGRPSPMGC